jgi:Mrp family chromosome partitioning ATPase
MSPDQEPTAPVPGPAPTPSPAPPQRTLQRRPARPTAAAPAVWITARARNALRRPLFIGTISVLTFIACLLALIVVPQQARRAAATIRPSAARPDTETTVASLQQAERQVASADSAIVASKKELTALISATAVAVAADTTAGGIAVGPALRARRDSLTGAVDQLGQLLARAADAPLLSVYRELAQTPAMQGDAQVKVLLDSLVAIERERESYNAVGGVDPVFVALTGRATEIGRGIIALAGLRRAAIRQELVALAPPAPTLPASIASRPMPDTMAKILARDTARTVAAEVANRLARERAELQRLDAREERARELSSVAASPSAMLAAALVFGAMLGFGVALLDEVRRPRIADANEIERATGVRVLGTIRPLAPSPERGRRAADRSGPPYLDPGADGHQLIYLTVATAGSNVVMLTVTGDSAAVRAVVAINFAAIAADEARSTLLVDTDATTSAVSSALRLRPSGGLSGVLSGTTAWPDAIRTTRVGRDRSIEVVPSGHGDPGLEPIRALLVRDVDRLTRRYDAIVLVSAVPQVTEGLAAALPITDVLYCARAGQTPLAQLKADVEAIVAGGAQLRGIVLWNAPDPALADVRAAEGTDSEEIVVPAATASS